MTDTEAAADITSPAKIAHVVLRSGRYDETLAWWQTVLGARVVHENPVVTFLTYDDEHHRLAIINMGDAEAPPPGSTGLEHFAFAYDTLDDLVGTYERLHTQGIEPFSCINHGMTLSMYFSDPDGAQVELQVDLCSPDDADTFMQSDEFAANPIGINYDPAQLAEEHRAGGTPTALGLYGPSATN